MTDRGRMEHRIRATGPKGGNTVHIKVDKRSAVKRATELNIEAEDPSTPPYRSLMAPWIAESRYVGKWERIKE